MREKKYIRLVLGMLLLLLCSSVIVPAATTSVQAAKKQTEEAAKKKKPKPQIKKVTITNKSNLQKLQVGESKKIKVSLKPSKKKLYKKLSFKSSKPKVASVSRKGKVKALRNGTTVITVKATDGSKKKARVKIQVYTLVKKVKISTAEGAFLVKGDTTLLKASVSPSTASKKKLKWSSSNPAVATVNKNGTVKAVGNGTVKIIAESTDGTGKFDTYFLQVFSLSKKNKIYAHRGYSAKAPENSLAAVKEAAKAGFYGVELDFWKTKDGVYVASHSNSLEGMFGLNMKITESYYYQISSYCMTAGNGVENYPAEGIATLDDVMEVLAKTSLHFNLEIKWSASKADLREILKILDGYDMNERIQIITFKEKVLTRLQSIMEEPEPEPDTPGTSGTVSGAGIGADGVTPESDTSQDSDTSPEPGTSGAPDESQGPGTSGTPDEPPEPGTSGTPDEPQGPGTSETPDGPQIPESPRTPVQLALLTSTPEEKLDDCPNAYTWCVKNKVNILVNYNSMTQKIKDTMAKADLQCGVYTIDDAYTAFIYLKGMEVDTITSNEMIFTD